MKETVPKKPAGTSCPSLAELEQLRTEQAPGELKSHLQQCPRCQTKLRRLETMAKQLRQLSLDQLPTNTEFLDRTIFALIAERAARIKRRRALRRPRWLGAIAAVAATITILSMLFYQTGLYNYKRSTIQQADINADGSVDIIDAYLMARAISSNRNICPEWDFNRDGLVDRADVDHVAMLAVRLNGGGW